MPALSAPATRMPRWLAILLLSLGALLLEVGYTRIVSYKLWYYYTYLVIGLALLGIGTGGVAVAVVRPIRRWATDKVVGVCATLGAVSIAIGYFVIARIPIDTRAIWEYGTKSSLLNLFRLGVICFTLFATFIAFGIIVSVLLGRAGDAVGRVYFADLVGAGIGCFLAVPLISTLGPPAVIILAALVFAIVGAASLPRRSIVFGFATLLVLLLGVGVVRRASLPDITVEDTKISGEGAYYSAWGPVFRVDVLGVGPTDSRLLAHDGTFGSGIHQFNGDVSTLGAYATDPRATPFQVLGQPPQHELIIGSAGGNEILASLYYQAPHIEAVELNPVTVGLLKNQYADYTGHLADRPDVSMHQGDGRTYLAKSNTDYDLVWYVAPDSYAATNAASAGAFVLSESYLYTREMIAETLQHLSPDGIMVVQFGELDLRNAPNRTARYIVTARAALEDLGITDPTNHLLAAGYVTGTSGDLSTIVVKRNAFTPEEVQHFTTGLTTIPKSVLFHAPGTPPNDSLVSKLAAGSDADVKSLVASYPKNITAISDDAPFFWHFSSFSDVLRNFLHPIDVHDPEDSIGERVLILLFGLSVVFAAVFLLLPFAVVRKKWRALPSKGTSAVYFAALGLGFMLFEITMIQRLTRFLGYPTYSLTVTLAAILVSTGIGSLLSQRVANRGRTALPLLLAALAVLTLFYEFRLDSLTDSLQHYELPVRVLASLGVLLPLGLCLGMFMPIGLRAVSKLTPFAEEYVAWAWAVNGFFSVIGSVLTTILSMTFGFNAVQFGALAMYAIASAAFLRLDRAAPAAAVPVDGGPVDLDTLTPVG
ncbi:MAG TPA: hypothetical protein VGJ03_18085 [Acidimicrobiales bacterium]